MLVPVLAWALLSSWVPSLEALRKEKGAETQQRDAARSGWTPGEGEAKPLYLVCTGISTPLHGSNNRKETIKG